MKLELHLIYFSILLFPSYLLSLDQYILLTMLYNEKVEERQNEYIACLEKNLSHPLIKKIHVFYDQSDDAPSKILDYLKEKKIEITFISKRITYGEFFEYTNANYPNEIIIISNADIYFNETLTALDGLDYTNKLLALTRWNVHKDGSLKPQACGNKCPCNCSADTWIYKTPFNRFQNDDIPLGMWPCDGRIAYTAKVSGLKVINPCLNVQCCHLHLTDIRNYDKTKLPGHTTSVEPMSLPGKENLYPNAK